jgi:hypothetical protein
MSIQATFRPRIEVSGDRVSQINRYGVAHLPLRNHRTSIATLRQMNRGITF